MNGKIGKQNSAPIAGNLLESSSRQSDSLANYGLEISLLLNSIAGSTCFITVQNLYIDRICRIEKNFTIDECHNLTSISFENDENRVEVSASKYAIYQSLIENGPPIIVSFFLGPWTDANGSKPILVISLLGYFLSALMYTIYSFLPKLSPLYILLCSIPMSLCGGLTASLISSVSLLTRETSIFDRSFRLGVVSVCIDAGYTIGYLLAKKAYYLWGFQEVFMITAFLHGLSVILSILLISEKVPDNSLTNSGFYAKCKEFFDFGSVKETVITCFKERQNRRRCWIIILFTCILFQYFSYLARNYLYLYTRNKFAWDFADYSNYAIANSLLTNIGGIIMTLLVIKFLQVPDILVGIITIMSNFAGLMIMIFANKGWLMYLGSGVQMFGSITTAVMRSILSKCVEPEEHGKMFSFITCVEMTMPFLAAPLYGIIYMNAAESLPNAIFILPIGLQIFLFLFYIYLFCTKGNFSPYSALQEDASGNVPHVPNASI